MTRKNVRFLLVNDEGITLSLFNIYFIAALLVTLLWFYTPSQLDSKSTDVPWGALASNELLASKHIDTISADCIESLAYVLTFNEYCR
jgi:hypothetical protein